MGDFVVKVPQWAAPTRRRHLRVTPYQWAQERRHSTGKADDVLDRLRPMGLLPQAVDKLTGVGQSYACKYTDVMTLLNRQRIG